jgi:hypothetical protein
MAGTIARRDLVPASLLTGTSVQGPTVTETPLEVVEVLSEGQPTRDDTETQSESCAVPGKDKGKEDGKPAQDVNTMDKSEELMHSGLMSPGTFIDQESMEHVVTPGKIVDVDHQTRVTPLAEGVGGLDISEGMVTPGRGNGFGGGSVQ